MTTPLSPLSTSPTLTKARARATRDGWDPAWIRAEVDARAVLDGGCYYDAEAAARVRRFFDRVLRHTDTSSGTVGPFQLLDWQADEFIAPIFGWKRADGTRRYRRAGLWVPKKNGKSTLAAGLELYFLVADHEPGAEVYSAANDRKQAGIIHGHAVRMVELSPKLNKRIGKRGIVRSTKTIYDAQSGSVFMALSADAPTKEGLNIHALIVDELHAMKSRVLWDTLIYGGAARRQPLILTISTAGVYDIATIGWEQYSYARDIINGNNDRDWSFFALIYEAEKDEDWTSVETWKKANPSYGKTVKVDAIAEECVEAQSEPKKQNTFRRYRLNQWVQQVTRWIPLEQWDANNVHPIDRSQLKGAWCVAGVDLAAVSDLTAYVLICECPEYDDCWDILPRFWVPEATLNDVNHRNYEMYQAWHRQIWNGFPLLESTPGESTDYDFIEAAILDDATTFNLRAVGIDRLFQGQQVQNHLTAEGVFVVAIGQGFMGQGPPMKEFERLWRARKVHHGGHPVLRWNADNVEVKQDHAGNLKIVKPHGNNDPRKVDGIQALVNGLEPLSRERNKAEPEFQMFFVGGGR